MSIEQEKIIDLVADDEKSNETVLFIMDHLSWDEPDYDHALKLQNKINAYLAFMESGEVYLKHPSAKGKRLVIEVRGKYPLNNKVEELYKKFKDVVLDAGFLLRFEYSSDR